MQHLPVLQLSNVSVSLGGKPVFKNISFDVLPGQQWAIIGAAATGKTTLANAIHGSIFYRGKISGNFKAGGTLKENTYLVSQQHRFKNLVNTYDFYYQQRFNSMDAENAQTVQQLLENLPGYNDENANFWLPLLAIEQLFHKPVLQLSNGENKRVQIAHAILSKASLLILDNPFIGMDPKGRIILENILNKLAENGIQLLLLLSPGHVPNFVTHIRYLEKEGLQKEILANSHTIWALENQEEYIRKKIQELEAPKSLNFEHAVKLENVSIQYGNKKVLDSISWQVKNGSRWRLSGNNGAGKSTLLSLITADNPQAYANKIFLFDKRKGSGESIWDIKQKIGYLSPELHLYFDNTVTLYNIIASGFFDTIGLFKQLTAKQQAQINWWLDFLQLTNESSKRLPQLSSAQQRLALIARAFIKNPPLLILDEPFQGLDQLQTTFVRTMIHEWCLLFNTTLIFVSHYDEDIPSVVQQVLHLENGKLNLKGK